jgi:protein ImuB
MRQRHGAAWRVRSTIKNQEGEPSSPPLAIVDKIKNAIQLVHLDEHAEHLGIEPGTSLADARAAFPDIEILEKDEKADRLLFDAIADWCDRYTPLIALDKPALELYGQYGLLLDITGCAHLFGGERELMKDLLARLFHQGIMATGAIAPTPGAAWALSRFQKPNENCFNNESIKNLDQIEQSLTPLPLGALRLTIDTINAMARLGLRTIGQLRSQPRAPIARRFGREVLFRLDQAMGSIEEAISPRRPVAELMAERRLPEPIALETDIEKTTLRLAGHLCEQMEKKGLGARKLVLCLFRVDGKTFHLEAGTSRPERDPSTIIRLFRERFAALQDEYDAGYGFETLRLCVLASEPIRQEDVSFMQSDAQDGSYRLMDRLAARLGSHNINRGLLQNSHLPENAEYEVPSDEFEALSKVINNESVLKKYIPDNQSPIRPLRLFAFPETIEAIAEVPDGPPIRFRWRKILHQVTRSEGPERIVDQWWGKSVSRQTRDYFRIEDDKGHRYWLFREGLYERETDKPKWYLHGQFA